MVICSLKVRQIGCNAQQSAFCGLFLLLSVVGRAVKSEAVCRRHYVPWVLRSIYFNVHPGFRPAVCPHLKPFRFWISPFPVVGRRVITIAGCLVCKVKMFDGMPRMLKINVACADGLTSALAFTKIQRDIAHPPLSGCRFLRFLTVKSRQ